MPDLTRAEVEQIKRLLPTLLHPAISLSTAAKFEALCDSWLTLDARVRELEAANARLTKLIQMQDEFITEKSGLAAERLAEVNRLAFALQAFKDGLEEETQG